MALPKDEGRLGLMNFDTVVSSNAVMKATKIWSKDSSLWVDWMQQRYAQFCAIDNIITLNQHHLMVWKSMVAARMHIAKC